MQVFTVGKNEDGMRLDNLALRLLPGAGFGFVCKMIRKKNIVVNDKRADVSDRVRLGDAVQLYLADDTLKNFGYVFTPGGQGEVRAAANNPAAGRTAAAGRRNDFDFKGHIIYEDDDVILVNKPAGILTQKAEETDVSLNEYLIDYLTQAGKLTAEQQATFRPSVCNRLDRNTSGIVCCGVSMTGLRELSKMFRERTVHKYYLTICRGRVESSGRRRALLIKDESANKVAVYESEFDIPAEKSGKSPEVIETAWKALKYDGDGNCSLVEVELFTGKSHQIRAHLASVGHPVAGDGKYGSQRWNRELRDKYKVKAQLLTAYRIVFEKNEQLAGISGREFKVAPDAGFFIN